MDALQIAKALMSGPATLAALAARLRGPGRDELQWALDDALARGWIASSAEAPCGPGGVCSTSAPEVFALTPAGRSAGASE